MSINDGDLHPIDVVVSLAENKKWEFDRITNDQISFEVKGLWRTYPFTIAWSPQDQVLRFICHFEMSPPKGDKILLLYDLLNLCNDELWIGSFTYWANQEMLVWRYGLFLTGGQIVTSEQIDDSIAQAVQSCDCYYPTFQLVGSGSLSPADAMKIAFTKAYGRA